MGRSLGSHRGETEQTDEHIPITRLLQADSGKTRCDDTPFDPKSASASPSTMDLPRYVALMCFRLSGRRQAENENGNRNGGRRIVCVVSVLYACDGPIDSLVPVGRWWLMYVIYCICIDIRYISHDKLYTTYVIFRLTLSKRLWVNIIYLLN